MKLNPNTVGLVLGGFMGLWHLIWSLLVVTGLAQPLLDLVLGLHFLNNPYTVGASNLVTAATLIVFTSIIGYGVGWVFAWMWNMMYKKMK